jgi:serine/threonine-protein kinase HipA
MINKLEVFLNSYDKDFFVGTLAYKNKTIYFEYDKSFLATGIIECIYIVLLDLLIVILDFLF